MKNFQFKKTKYAPEHTAAFAANSISDFALMIVRDGKTEFAAKALTGNFMKLAYADARAYNQAAGITATGSLVDLGRAFKAAVLAKVNQIQAV